MTETYRPNGASAYRRKSRQLFGSPTRRYALFVLCLLVLGSALFGQVQNALPAALRDVGIDPKLGGQVPLELKLTDEVGAPVQLKQYFNRRPVILALVYYACPMLCNQVLDGLGAALKTLSFNLGSEFDVVTVSFDPNETPEMARSKKETYLRRYGRAAADRGWHFLTGSEAAIEQLTTAVGFRYAYDGATRQYAHASGIVVLTPEGKLANYFYGIQYAPKDLRLALVEASENKIGTAVDRLLLYCYHYDPMTGKYGPVVINVVRIGGAVTVLGLVALIVVLKRRGPA